MSHQPDGVRLCFPGLADYLLSRDFAQIEVRPRAGVPLATLRHLLIDHVLPSALAGRGEMVLHASAVGLTRGTVVFLGPSGVGKSTLAAAFAGRGRPVVSDDGSRVVEAGSRFHVVPSYPGVRLWPDGQATLVAQGASLPEVAHNSAKRRWLPPPQPDGPLDLIGAFALDPMAADDVEIVMLTARQALIEAMENSYQLPGTGAEQIGRHLDRMIRLVESCPFARLRCPDDLSAIGAVLDAVETVAAGF